MKGRLAAHLLAAVILLSATLAPHPAEACGGVTATIADDPKPFGVRTASGPGGATLHYAQAGNVYVATTDMKISSALAEAIAAEEWRDAGHDVIHVGTAHPTATEYGWGGKGQAVAVQPERYTIEVWSKIHQGTIFFAVRADTAHWMALLFKDFPHHGMIGDFNDAKLLTANGVADYFVAERPGRKTPGPRKRQGVHTWMASGDLVQDPQPNLIASAHRILGKTRDYEFAFPLMNDSLGNTAWEMDGSYQIAVLVGPANEFQGVTEDTWMSDQVHLRIGSRSTASIYHPPLPVAPGGTGPQPGGYRHK